MRWVLPGQCPCHGGLQGPHLPRWLQDWLLNSDQISSLPLLSSSRIWGDSPQLLALGTSITGPTIRGQLGGEMPLTQAGCCRCPASGRGRPPAPKSRVPLNASAAAQPGLAEEAWWRMEICWAPLQERGQERMLPPVPDTPFACDKAWPCQDQWPSLQPAPCG